LYGGTSDQGTVFEVTGTGFQVAATGANQPTISGIVAVQTVTDRTTVFNEVYQQILGFAPAASTTALPVTGPAAPDPSITTFQYYVNEAGSELGGYGAVAGVLLWTAEQTSPQSGRYPAPVASFLTEAPTSAAAGGDTAAVWPQPRDRVPCRG
jgi:hypothetical protein